MVEALSNELWAQVFSFLEENEMFVKVSPTCHKLCSAVKDSIETVTLDASGATVTSPGTLSRYMIGIDPCAFPRVLSGTLSWQTYIEMIEDKKNMLTDSNLCSFRRLVDYANLKNLTIRNVRGRDCWLRVVEPLRRATQSRVRNILFENCIMDPAFVHFLSSILPHFIDLRVLRFEQCIFFPPTMKSAYLTRLWHHPDGRVPPRKRTHSSANDRVYIGKYSDAFLRLINAIGRTRKLENLVISECSIGAMQKIDVDSTMKLADRRLSSGNPCLDFVTGLESHAQPPEKIPFRFLDGVTFNLTQTCARLRNLKRLELDENCLFDAGVYSIARSISCGDLSILETLSLMGNFISSFGFITLLFALKNSRKITDVDLSDNQINFVARVKEDGEAIDLDVPEMMTTFVKEWVGRSSENFHLGLAGNQPCKSVEDKMVKAIQKLEESKVQARKIRNRLTF